MEVYIDDMLVRSLVAEQHIAYLEQGFAILRRYNMKLNLAKGSFGVSLGKFLGYFLTPTGNRSKPRVDTINQEHSFSNMRKGCVEVD